MTNNTEHKENRKKPSNAACNALTGIPESIHCPATQYECEAGYELDDIAIEHFLDTLAEVAISIAARELSEKQGQERRS